MRSERAADKTGTPFRYDGRCGRLSKEEIAARLAEGRPFSIRLRMPDEEIAWDDAVHERISFQGRDLDDFIILRSDGSPIYNLAVVSDDIEMEITHVIRGDDHISNTPKQIAIYRALGKPIPIFAHVPMILGADGKKLSKRHGATAVGDYQQPGHPAARDAELPGAAGLVSRWRSGDPARGRDDRALLTRRNPEEARGVRSHQARVDERPVPVAGSGRRSAGTGEASPG